MSISNLQGVRSYIINQKKHHRERTFQEELRSLLADQDIQFDEKYIWD